RGRTAARAGVAGRASFATRGAGGECPPAVDLPQCWQKAKAAGVWRPHCGHARIGDGLVAALPTTAASADGMPAGRAPPRSVAPHSLQKVMPTRFGVRHSGQTTRASLPAFAAGDTGAAGALFGAGGGARRGVPLCGGPGGAGWGTRGGPRAGLFAAPAMPVIFARQLPQNAAPSRVGWLHSGQSMSAMKGNDNAAKALLYSAARNTLQRQLRKVKRPAM